MEATGARKLRVVVAKPGLGVGAVFIYGAALQDIIDVLLRSISERTPA